MGPTIDIYTEDRTGGGLQNFLVKAAQARRVESGKPPLNVPSGAWASAKSNTALLNLCEKYDVFRFQRRPRLDHVFFIIDLKEVERHVGQPPIRPRNGADRSRVIEATVAEMSRRARGGRSLDEWERISAGFHPSVLEWERESLIIAVSDALELGAPPEDLNWCESPARQLGERYMARHGTAYDKRTNGFTYLTDTIATRPDLVQRVLDSNSSVQQMVDALVAL
jgi:hypothetical protein